MESLRVTFHLSEAMILSSTSARLLSFDDLLAAALYQETGDEHAGDKLPLAKLEHPNGAWVYHASTWRAVGSVVEEGQTIYKRMSGAALNAFDLVDKWDRGRGLTKDYELTYQRYVTPAVRFYCYGDGAHINHLVQRLSWIGKKRALGSGRVWKVEVESSPVDYSLSHAGLVTRPIPVELCGDWHGTQQLVAYRSPYWDPRNRALCLIPPITPLIEPEEVSDAA
jgi:CRISPR type IV-associated protein Csf3